MKNRFSFNSITFIAIVSAYFSFMLNVKFWQFAFDKIDITSIKVAIFAFSLPFFIFIPLFWFFSLLTLPRVGKPLIMLLLVLSAASDYALQNLGIVINSDMIRNFVETNVREATDLVTLHAFFYVLIIGVIPAILVYRTNIVFLPFKKEVCRRLLCFLFGVLMVGVIAAASYKEYASFGRNNKQVRYYINTFNYIYAVGRYYKRASDANREFVILDKAPTILPNQTGKPRVLVLIVGETARAQNFSLYGYDKDTNPLLAKNDEIIRFKDVTSCGTATAVSLPCMFSHLTRAQFSVTKALYSQNLLDIAKAAGYDIIWKDNDDGCKKVCDRVNKFDAKAGNKQPYCFGDYCHDDILLDGFEERLKNITKDTLIVLHTMGSHGPTYFKRYPDRFKKFTPACDTANLQDCTKEQIINTYNNTIVYTDYIIASVIETLKKHNELQSGMLYVSDHGESLGENNIYLHGLPYAIAPDMQKKVPMVLWLSESIETSLGIDKTCLKQQAETKAFSHDNYFHSVLRLLSVKSTAYERSLDIFEKCER
ncbi:MAG: phosphoethanolamine--lipid A transferase [Alphaproteobacteria bacterium]|nr:phosphoethanolamine--lipid A transferase [Alphaproteobacteria bacterium]